MISSINSPPQIVEQQEASCNQKEQQPPTKQIPPIQEAFERTLKDMTIKLYEGKDDPSLGKICLSGTPIFSAYSTPAGKWEPKRNFLQIGSDIISTSYSKNDPLCICSLGSAFLLMETILTITLITNGFKNIYILPADPHYSLKGNEATNNKLFTAFRTAIEAAYIKTHAVPLAKERIKFLSKGQNVVKYLPGKANVVVFKSIPPYAKILSDLAKIGIMQQPEHLLAGNIVVDPTCANALSFIPLTMAEKMNETLPMSPSLPLTTFNTAKMRSYLDWGCKVYMDGTYRLIFQGDLLLYSKMKNSLQQLVSSILTTELPIPRSLTQEQITIILQKIQTTVSTQIEDLNHYYLRDYFTDFQETKKIIQQKNPKSITTLTLADTEPTPLYMKLEQEPSLAAQKS